MAFYDNLLAICKRKGTSPTAVAQKIGLSNSAATYWKRGSFPRPETVMKIAEALGCDAKELIPPARAASYGILMADMSHNQRMMELAREGYAFSERENDLIYAFSTMNDAGQLEVVHFAQNMAQVPKFKKQAGDTGAVDTEKDN